MSEHEHMQRIDAPPARIFDFISEISNLPKYLPTTHSAQSQGEGRVRTQGEANGHKYDSDGYFRQDRQAMRLEWGADEGYYSGWMQISPQGNASDVTVHLSFSGTPPGAKPEDMPPQPQIQEALEKALNSIRNHVQGLGGKEEPSAAT